MQLTYVNESWLQHIHIYWALIWTLLKNVTSHSLMHHPKKPIMGGFGLNLNIHWSWFHPSSFLFTPYSHPPPHLMWHLIYSPYLTFYLLIPCFFPSLTPLFIIFFPHHFHCKLSMLKLPLGFPHWSSLGFAWRLCVKVKLRAQGCHERQQEKQGLKVSKSPSSSFIFFPLFFSFSFSLSHYFSHLIYFFFLFKVILSFSLCL
jgi:hypothetical protein